MKVIKSPRSGVTFMFSVHFRRVRRVRRRRRHNNFGHSRRNRLS